MGIKKRVRFPRYLRAKFDRLMVILNEHVVSKGYRESRDEKERS